MNYSHKRKDFKNLIKNLIDVAKADGIITLSEANLLHSVKFTVQQYEEALSIAEEDGIISDTEYLILYNLENELLKKAFTLIEQGSELDDDTKALVEKLFEILMKTLK